MASVAQSHHTLDTLNSGSDSLAALLSQLETQFHSSVNAANRLAASISVCVPDTAKQLLAHGTLTSTGKRLFINNSPATSLSGATRAAKIARNSSEATSARFSTKSRGEDNSWTYVSSTSTECSSFVLLPSGIYPDDSTPDVRVKAEGKRKSNIQISHGASLAYRDFNVDVKEIGTWQGSILSGETIAATYEYAAFKQELSTALDAKEIPIIEARLQDLMLVGMFYDQVTAGSPVDDSVVLADQTVAHGMLAQTHHCACEDLMLSCRPASEATWMPHRLRDAQLGL